MGRKDRNDRIDIETTQIVSNLTKTKKLPILTLDSRFHMLFPEHKKTPVIKRLEKQVNDLLKRQGKLVQEAKDIKKLKRKFMQDIVLNMQEAPMESEAQRVRKLEYSQKYIKELNDKLVAYDDELELIPRKIMMVNEQLIRECLKVCYANLHKNKEQITELSLWIDEMRTTLKEKVVEKQEMEQENATIYSYMHDLLGPEIIELFDEKNLDRE